MDTVPSGRFNLVRVIPVGENVLSRLADFSVDENGFLLWSDRPLEESYRHYSYLLMIYPHYLVTVDQVDGEDLIERSLAYWYGIDAAHTGYSYTGTSYISAAMGYGETMPSHTYGACGST